MSLLFPYSEDGGILKSLFNKNAEYYKEDITLISRGSSAHPSEGAFDFNDSKYSYGKTHGFCFKKGSAFAIGYEIKTSFGRCRPKTWNFSASNDGNSWKDIETYSKDMNALEKLYFEWNHGIYKCFRIVGSPIEGYQCSGVDVMQIDIYGTYFPNGVKQKSCIARNNHITRKMSFM